MPLRPRPKREHSHISSGRTERDTLGLDFDDLVSPNLVLDEKRLAIDQRGRGCRPEQDRLKFQRVGCGSDHSIRSIGIDDYGSGLEPFFPGSGPAKIVKVII